MTQSINMSLQSANVAMILPRMVREHLPQLDLPESIIPRHFAKTESQNRTEVLQKHDHANRVFFHTFIDTYDDLQIFPLLMCCTRLPPNNFFAAWLIPLMSHCSPNLICKKRKSDFCVSHIVLFFVRLAQIKRDGALNSAVTEQTATPESGFICSTYGQAVHTAAVCPVRYACLLGRCFTPSASGLCTA